MKRLDFDHAGVSEHGVYIYYMICAPNGNFVGDDVEPWIWELSSKYSDKPIAIQGQLMAMGLSPGLRRQWLLVGLPQRKNVGNLWQPIGNNVENGQLPVLYE